MKLAFHGKVLGSKVEWDYPAAFLKEVKSLEGQRVTVTIGKYRVKKDRSDEQNRYYWGIIVQTLADEIGYSRDEMHDALKYKFLRIHADGPLVTCRSTADLTTAEFETYLSQIRTWASVDMQINLPLPNEVEQ